MAVLLVTTDHRDWVELLVLVAVMVEMDMMIQDQVKPQMVQMEAPLQQIMGLTIFFLVVVEVVDQIRLDNLVVHLAEERAVLLVDQMLMVYLQLIMAAVVLPVQEMEEWGQAVLTLAEMVHQELLSFGFQLKPMLKTMK